MKMSDRWVWLAVLGSVVASGCSTEPAPKREWTPADHAQPSEPAPERTPQQPAGEGEAALSPREQTLRAAGALFAASCASCHGRDGRGLGEGRPPGARIPDMTTAAFQSSRSDSQLALMIRNGRGMMPGFGKQLTEPGIDALVQYVRSLGAAVAAPDAGTVVR